MFYDLNVPVPVTAGSALAAQEQLETRKRVELLVHLGYQAVAYNYEITGKIPNAWNVFTLDRPTWLKYDGTIDRNTGNPAISSYDIVAVQPTSENPFQAACGTFEIDIISLDMSARLPFYLKHSTVGLAVERGVYFELCYSAAIRGTLSMTIRIFEAQLRSNEPAARSLRFDAIDLN
ncbi:hypothetical protein BGZ65_011883 [Modicella reniformis]|uniref:Uncharacterized protein n=1 Tax=Modicella reniformis TaxID=1440133 RepID=A0A9P6MJJ6_9FUNG|nr:hypothetical protein BGZ65_011883 [Modicella reniformis]